MFAQICVNSDYINYTQNPRLPGGVFVCSNIVIGVVLFLGSFMKGRK